MNDMGKTPRPTRGGHQNRFPRLLVSGLVLLTAGCSAFNPAFVNLIDPTGTAGLATLPNPPGHVVLTFVNNAEVDERLLEFLASRLNLTDAQKRNLRPRVRFRVRITFTDGTFQTVEFINGSRNLVDPAFDASAFPDLNQNDLNNVVAVCDVASIQIEPGTNIEVFLPVELVGFELVEVTNPGGNTVTTTFVERQRTLPQFRALQVDTVDEDGNIILRRNIGVRDAPSPTPNVVCGSVVAIVVDGVLSVPFLEGISDLPSFDIDDVDTVASIGGRYEFTVSVQ